MAFGCLALALPLLAADVEGIGGIGLVIVQRDNDRDLLRTKSVYPGSPAERAGITTNGFLISINGTNALSMSITQVVSMVRGPVGAFVTLQIADSTMTHTNEFTVKRARIIIADKRVKFTDD